MSAHDPLTSERASMFQFRRARLVDGRWMLSWHDYKTIEARDKWAAIYRARGDRVEVVDD